MRRRNRWTSSVDVGASELSKSASESLPGQNASRARFASTAACRASDWRGAGLTAKVDDAASPTGGFGLATVKPVSPKSRYSSRRAAEIAACTDAGILGASVTAVSRRCKPMSTGSP